MATSHDKLENKVQVNNLHGDIRQYMPVFLAGSYLTFTNELCQLWTEFHEIFTPYREFICTVNAHS